MKVICPDRKNQARIDVLICQSKCDKRWECKVYQEAMHEQVAQNRKH